MPNTKYHLQTKNRRNTKIKVVACRLKSCYGNLESLKGNCIKELKQVTKPCLLTSIMQKNPVAELPSAILLKLEKNLSLQFMHRLEQVT